MLVWWILINKKVGYFLIVKIFCYDDCYDKKFLNLIRFEYKIIFNRIKIENDLFVKIKNFYLVIFFFDK